jgi:hypothetical protein
MGNHCVADNYGTHKHPNVHAWRESPSALSLALHSHVILVAEPRRALVWQDHSRPHPSRRVQKRGRTRTAINDYIQHNNANPQPFVWTKSVDDIILKVNRGRAALDKSPLAHSG